jgi:hypothetical protein
VEKCGTARQATDDIIWHMHIANWIPKATDTLRMCNTYCSSNATVVVCMHCGVMSHMHCLSCKKMVPYQAGQMPCQSCEAFSDVQDT